MWQYQHAHQIRNQSLWNGPLALPRMRQNVYPHAQIPTPSADARQRGAYSATASRTPFPTRYRPRARRGTPDYPGLAKKKAQQIEARLENESLAPLPAPEGDAIEIDELCLRQSPAFWVWLAVSRQTRQVLGFGLGDRTDAMLEAVWEQVPAAYRDTPVYTDHWGAYERFFPAAQHQACDKGSGLTSIALRAQHQMAAAAVGICAAQLRGCPQDSRRYFRAFSLVGGRSQPSV